MATGTQVAEPNAAAAAYAKRLAEEATKAHTTAPPPGSRTDLPSSDVAPFTKAYTPWQNSIKSMPARQGQDFFDYHDPRLTDKNVKSKLPHFTAGAGTDAIRWLLMSRSAKSLGGNPMENMQKAVEESDDARMKAGWSSLDKYLNSLNAMDRKALVESTMVDGGALVPPEFSAEFIYLLRASTVVLESGASTINMKSSQLTIGRQNLAGTAFYEGETQAVTASQQQFGQLQLQVKKLMALTPISNDLLRDGGPDVEAIVRDDLIQVVALRQDLAWLRGDGTLGTCKGILNLVNSLNLLQATQGGSSATFQEIAFDVGRLIAALKNANVDKFAPETQWGWVMSPRSEQYLRTVSSTFGVFPFKDGMDRDGEFFGIQYKTTTAVPNTLGTGGNASEVYLVAWPAAVVGMNMPLELLVFPNGTAPDLNGTIISGISNDMTWLRAITRHDFKLRYDLGAAVLQNVLWGT
jgi:HK97 family phage major capsid protein